MSQNNQVKEDRRVFERFPVALPVNLFDLDVGKELDANTCDISAKGVGIVSQEYLKPGNHLELWLNIKDGREPFYTRGTVMWSGEQEAGKYRAGISLERAELMGISRMFRP
jgi:hypothetical protein